MQILRVVTPSYIDAYTCAQDLLIGGLFILQKRLKGMVFLKIKVNACILIQPISTYNFLANIVKVPYFSYTTFFFNKIYSFF